MTIPTIHLNGTSREQLSEGLYTAIAAIDAAYRAIKDTAPNGRDYYPQGPDAIRAATDEHMDRLRRLDQIKTEMERILIAID